MCPDIIQKWHLEDRNGKIQGEWQLENHSFFIQIPVAPKFIFLY